MMENQRWNISIIKEMMITNSKIDAGFEDLDLQKDAAKIMLYMQNDIISFNNGRKYQITKKRISAVCPCYVNFTCRGDKKVVVRE